MRQHNHYFKDVSGLREIDVYRVLSLYNVTHPCIQHAIKKLLCAGIRGAKDQQKDWREAVVSIQRALEMADEDACPLRAVDSSRPTADDAGWQDLKRLENVAAEGSASPGAATPWTGGLCPVADDAVVWYRLRSGRTGETMAGNLIWSHHNTASDIVEYRVL